MELPPLGPPRSVRKMLARAGPILARLPEPGSMVEVGVSVGILAAHLLRERPLLQWHGVDPWRGIEEQPAAYVQTGDVHAAMQLWQAEKHMAEAIGRLRRYGSRAVVCRQASPAAARGFDDASQDLVFIDGDHSREGTLADCRAWWPKVKSGGWLGGHDFANGDPRFRFGVDAAVKAFAAEVGESFVIAGGLTWWFRRV